MAGKVGLSGLAIVSAFDDAMYGLPFRVLGPGPNGLAQTPPMGWMSWEIFRCQTNCTAYPDSCIDHNLYEQMTDRIAEDGYLALGYDQVSIDDCWENRGGRDENGRLFPDSSRFPSGMKALGDYMHSKGVRFGTYSAEGTKTCGGFPGTKDHEEIDAQTFAEWGVDYLKMDGCYNNKSWYVIGYPKAGAALQATGRNITYSCSWPACLGGNESAKPFGAMIDAGCNLWRNYVPDIQCNWKSLSKMMDHFGQYGKALQPWAGPGHWHDADMLIIGNECITTEEERTQMAIWAIIASPLIMGNDLRKVPESARAILQNKDAIAVSQDPLGKMGIRLGEAAPTEVWSRELSNGDVAVALFNRGANETHKESDITVIFSDLGLSGDVAVYDIWSHTHIGVFQGSYLAKGVAWHDSAFLRLSSHGRVLV